MAVLFLWEMCGERTQHICSLRQMGDKLKYGTFTFSFSLKDTSSSSYVDLKSQQPGFYFFVIDFRGKNTYFVVPPIYIFIGYFSTRGPVHD